MIVIRREEPADAPAVSRVNEQAFGQPDEARLVDALRSAEAVTLSLVAEDDREIIGHILFSPVTIETAKGVFAGVGLAPMAVAPARQRSGVGSQLARVGLDLLRQEGHEVVVVVGHAEYYPRFGFRPGAPLGLRWEIDVPEDVFMVLELRPGALAERRGIVRYRREFAGA